MNSGIENSIKTALITLAVIFVLNQLPVTRSITQQALN